MPFEVHNLLFPRPGCRQKSSNRPPTKLGRRQRFSRFKLIPADPVPDARCYELRFGKGKGGGCKKSEINCLDSIGSEGFPRTLANRLKTLANIRSGFANRRNRATSGKAEMNHLPQRKNGRERTPDHVPFSSRSRVVLLARIANRCQSAETRLVRRDSLRAAVFL